jgi:hypothetical protein
MNRRVSLPLTLYRSLLSAGKNLESQLWRGRGVLDVTGSFNGQFKPFRPYARALRLPDRIGEDELRDGIISKTIREEFKACKNEIKRKVMDLIRRIRELVLGRARR